MQYTLAAIGLVAAVANAMPQMATGAPSDCKSTYPGTFEIETVNVTSTRRSIEKRQSSALTLTLNNGELTDSKGRIGYIAANNQFQFDNPVQKGTKYASGWAVCPDGTLVLGKDSVFQQCLSGTFYNLYDENPAPQCNSVHIYVINSSSGSAASGTAAVSQQSDGQPTGTPATGKPVTQITDGQIQAPTGNPITQIGDGQIQAPTGNPVTQISDGQIQAPTAKPSSAAPTGQPVTQISDGQIQAATSVAAASGNGTMPTASASPYSPAPYTGAASSVSSSVFGLFAGILAVAFL